MTMNLASLPLIVALGLDGVHPLVWTIGIIGLIVALLIFLASATKMFYKRCSSNQVLVVYGARTGGEGRTSKTVHGGGSFVWPVIQSYEYLSLEPVQIEIPLRGALSSENIRVNVPSVFTVAVGTEPAVMNNAAIRLLGLRCV